VTIKTLALTGAHQATLAALMQAMCYTFLKTLVSPITRTYKST